MKYIVLSALALSAQAITVEQAAQPSAHDIWNGNWAAYRGSRVNENDCDVREAENWLGGGQCKYSWECRGARMCEGNGWCLGNDACDEVSGAWHIAPGSDGLPAKGH